MKWSNPLVQDNMVTSPTSEKMEPSLDPASRRTSMTSENVEIGLDTASQLDYYYGLVKRQLLR